jgi:hypothetical protein
MKKFIVIYHADSSAMAKMKESSPEEMEKAMGAWKVWADKCGSGLVDMGSPLGNGLKVSDSGSVASDKGVVGYSILQAEDMEGAKKLLKEHPHLGWNESCDIEVHECLPMPGE